MSVNGHANGGQASRASAQMRPRSTAGRGPVRKRAGMQCMSARWCAARPWPGPPITPVIERGSGKRGSSSHTVHRSCGPRSPRPIPWARVRCTSPARSRATRRSMLERCEESAPRLVLDRGRTKRNARDDHVLDQPREAQPAPARGREQHRVGVGPERLEPARKALAARVAGAKHEHPPARPRRLDGPGHVVEVRGIGPKWMLRFLLMSASLAMPTPHWPERLGGALRGTLRRRRSPKGTLRFPLGATSSQ